MFHFVGISTTLFEMQNSLKKTTSLLYIKNKKNWDHYVPLTYFNDMFRLNSVLGSVQFSNSNV